MIYLNEGAYFGRKLYLPNDCQFLRNIGEGTFGQVICVTRNGQNMAIKVISEECDDEFYIQAIREIKILKLMKHENIIEMFYFYHCKNKIYLVFEFMETDLCKIISSKQELSEEHVLYFVIQILNGLNALHCSGIIHRDLKPANILVNTDCKLKLADFGLSCGIEENNDTPPEYVVTRWYRPPEILFQCSSNQKIDIWSLGCIFVELINRKPLFPGSNTHHQIKKILEFYIEIKDSDASFLGEEKYKKLKRMFPQTEKNNKHFLEKNGFEHYEDIILSMLSFNPENRLLASEYLSKLCTPNFFESFDSEKYKGVVGSSQDISEEYRKILKLSKETKVYD